MPAVIHIRDCGPAGLMRPVPVPALSKPVEINVRRYDQCYQMSLLRALVIRTRSVFERVLDGRGPDRRTGERTVHRTGGSSRLSESIGPIVRRVVVAIVVVLLLASVIPPSRFVEWSARAYQ